MPQNTRMRHKNTGMCCRNIPGLQECWDVPVAPWNGPQEHWDVLQEYRDRAQEHLWDTGMLGWALETSVWVAEMLGCTKGSSLGMSGRASGSTRENQGPMECFGLEKPPQAAPSWDTHLVGEGCSESELWELPGGFWLLRFIQAFSLGGGAGITFGFSSRDLEGGEGGSSSFPRGSFSRDFSLSLLRVAGGHGSVWELPDTPGWDVPAAPDPDSLRPVGPEPADVPGGPAGPLWEDSLPVRDRSWFSSLRQLGCLG